MTRPAPSRPHDTPARLDPVRLREDFPILAQSVHGHPLIYLDGASTSQKPRAVIDAIARFYAEDCANTRRGLHELGERATRAYEDARERVCAFLGAAQAREIVFVRGTTEAINLVAQSYLRPRLAAADRVLVTEMEHHSNIVPWQLVCEERGAELCAVPVDDAGELDMDAFERLLSPRVKLVAVTHVSNALGTVNPVREIVAMAHRHGVPVLVDGAQAVAHRAVDVADLGCDFYAFSGHKLYGPFGIGVLFARAAILEAMPPWQGGGNMIRSVDFAHTTYDDIPYRFEAGTPNVAGAVGLGAALDYVSGTGLEAIGAHERELLARCDRHLAAVPGLRLLGATAERANIASFVLEGIHPHDVGTVLDAEGIAVRAGHHCAQPLMRRFGVAATVRVSLSLHTTAAEIDALATALQRARELLG